MAVPSTITDLNVVANSNSPAGSEAIGTSLDDYLRGIQAIIRREQAKGADVASASTVNIGATTDGNYIHITGTTAITSFGTVAAGIRRTVVFDGALTLTHNATSLILPTGANITTAAGDVAEFVSEGSGNWRCARYMKASGAALTGLTVSTTQRIVGRKTAGSGASEECTLSEILDFIGSAAQGDILYRDAASWARLGAGTSGQFLKTQGAGANPTWAAAGGTTSGTAVASTSGTAIDFTGIPSTAKRIMVLFNGVSTNGSAQLRVQLGAGSVETTGYAGSGSTIVSTVASANFSAGFDIYEGGSSAATFVRSGALFFALVGSNVWVCTGAVGNTEVTRSSIINGSKTLSGTLDRVRITTSNGTDTFDAGSINILYE